MGSWSVYCGISNIAITAGKECVLLPIKPNKGEYLPYLPATLPIFGKYDDYGGLENIVEDVEELEIDINLHTSAYFISLLIQSISFIILIHNFL